MPKRKRRMPAIEKIDGGVVCITRPPAVPTVAEHLKNMDRVRVTSETLATWLGVTVDDIALGASPAIRVAVAYYLKRQDRATMRKLS